jgi:hypothetical protein
MFLLDFLKGGECKHGESLLKVVPSKTFLLISWENVTKKSKPMTKYLLYQGAACLSMASVRCCKNDLVEFQSHLAYLSKERKPKKEDLVNLADEEAIITSH